jgi:hypothetical protein
MSKKELVCQGFIAGVRQDALNTGEMIARQLREQGLISSLEDHLCLNTFAAEWSFARLIWLELQAKKIADSKLRKSLLTEIAISKTELLRLIPDLKELQPDYLMMAMMHENGEKDPAGHPYGPGPFISWRYRKHVEAITRTVERDPPRLMPSEKVAEEEGMLMMLLGDKTCWYLRTELNKLLLDVLATDT